MSPFHLRTLLSALMILMAVQISGCKIYQSIGKSVGGFVHPVTGQYFVHIPNTEWKQDKEALIYIYRPASEWANDEIESPSVYVDDNHYLNLRSGAYTWLAVSPGTRHIAMRRPLLGLEQLDHIALDLIVDQELEVEAGKVYYLRYSEVDEPELNPELPSDDPWQKGDLRLVSNGQALHEIVDTRFLNSDMLAPNHAAASIVADNIAYDFERRQQAIEEARAEELAALKASGHYRSGNWWCLYLCGGGPTKRLEADKQMKQLEKEIVQYELELAASKPSPWWQFW
ncbi:MAG: DUF2846 domain-containing protein [Gammaproteobacteria bacterium]|nr:MAG: DUF2846 domain-containing protein [Gammaproteobacteria bacterium]